MSRDIFNAARTAYVRLLPYLPAAARVALGATVGAAVLGPAGVFAGAAAGTGADPTVAQMLLNGFTAALQYVWLNPFLVASVLLLILMLRIYLRGQGGAGHQQALLEHED